MAVSHSNAAKVAATTAVTGLIGGAGGKLVFRATSANIGSLGTALATIDLQNPPFGTPNSTTGIATATTTGSPAIVGSATVGAGISNISVANATLESSSAAVILCSVTASGGGGDITFNGPLAVSTGDVIQCLTLTYASLAQ